MAVRGKKKSDLGSHPDYGADFESHEPFDVPTSTVIVNADEMASRASKAEKADKAEAPKAKAKEK